MGKLTAFKALRDHQYFAGWLRSKPANFSVLANTADEGPLAIFLNERYPHRGYAVDSNTIRITSGTRVGQTWSVPEWARLFQLLLGYEEWPLSRARLLVVFVTAANSSGLSVGRAVPSWARQRQPQASTTKRQQGD